jgi:hypothetical protein
MDLVLGDRRCAAASINRLEPVVVSYYTVHVLTMFIKE